MRFVLIADTFSPHRTSGAVQLRDLSLEFARQGHQITVLLPSSEQDEPWILEQNESIKVLRLKALRTKDIGYIRRTFGELTMPFLMLFNLRKSPLYKERWEGVIWYSPSIFHGPLASALKKKSGCKSYLIIRDIFPEWAVDMKLMKRGLPYVFFKAVARYQYSVADVIGVQTSGNVGYFSQWKLQPGRTLEVLQNWLGVRLHGSCPIRLDQTSLANRKIFVYAGNMGVAQGMDILLDLVEQFSYRTDVGFLFVGRGSESARLKDSAQERRLQNVLFYDEIHPDDIPNLYDQCTAGIVSLDPRHKSHNIPGKFLTYMQSGLPVLGNINPGNDLVNMIRNEQVGQVCDSNRLDDLVKTAHKLLDQVELDEMIKSRCRKFFEREFAVKNAVDQIVTALVF
jgi:glycosyltransferase involved in cell wall biosynthesis